MKPETGRNKSFLKVIEILEEIQQMKANSVMDGVH